MVRAGEGEAEAATEGRCRGHSVSERVLALPRPARQMKPFPPEHVAAGWARSATTRPQGCGGDAVTLRRDGHAGRGGLVRATRPGQQRVSTRLAWV